MNIDNGHPIMDIYENLLIDKPYRDITLVFRGKSWRVSC